MARKLW